MPTTFSVMSFTQNAKLWIYFIPLCTMLILLYFAFNSQWNTFSFNGSNQVNLDGCYHVYLDVGTHVGIQVFIEVNQKHFCYINFDLLQIRKLFEPRLYPGAPIHSVFDRYFHRNEENMPYICVVGFEPNPKHEEWLNHLQSAYGQCGWRTHIFTRGAVSNTEGYTFFYSDNDFGNLEWGGTIINPQSNQYGHIRAGSHEGYKVQLIRLSKFINEVVAKRRIPYLDPKIHGDPKVLMKLDIEGSEVEVVPDLLEQKSVDHLDGCMVEFHIGIVKDEKRKKAARLLKEAWTKWTEFYNLVNYHQIGLLSLDDETFYKSNQTLPQC